MALIEAIRAQRVELADLLETLSPPQLATRSYCGQWTVHEVAGHLLMPLITPTRVFVAGAARSFGNFNKANDRLSREFAARTPIAEVAGRLRAEADNRFHAPTFGLDAPMTELVVHGQDIRRPLGLPWAFPAEALGPVLDMLASRKAVRGFVRRGRLDGLHLQATDVEWSSGQGAPVRGPGAALAYAMTGRREGLDELTGEGVELLRSR